MSNPLIIDYANTCFQYPVLDKIHGQPSFESLKNLKKQLKTNSQCVGDPNAFGYLGLVLPQAEFTRIANTQFTPPADPGTFTVPPFTAVNEAMRLQEEHKERVRVFRECSNVEKALLKQVVAALEPQYMKQFRCPLTNSIRRTLRDVLQTLFSTYGRVSSDELAKVEEKVKTYYWPATDPPDTLYNLVEELIYYSEAANDIISLLSNPPTPTIPSLHGGETTRNALLDLATILKTNQQAFKDFQQARESTTAAAANLQASKRTYQQI